MKENGRTGGALGLDVGTSRIVLAHREGEDFAFQSQLNAFVAVPYRKITERTLRKERVPHVARDSEILIYGNESERFADLFHLEPRRPMSGGILNADEPDGPTLMRHILQAVSGGADGEGKTVYFSVPAPPLGKEENISYHEAALRQLVGDFGYEVHSLNEGLAVIYAELERSNYTGIGVSFGGGLCNVCLAYLSAPLFSFSVGKAGDFIDASAATVTSEIPTRVRITKETEFRFNGSFPDRLRQAIGVFYQEMIDAVVAGLKEAFSNSRNVPKIGRPIPVVLAGGSALAGGFRDRFADALNKAALPVSIADVTLAEDPLNTTAKGALVAALAEA